MGRSFRRDKDDIYEGSFDDQSFRQKKAEKLARQQKRREKEDEHNAAFEVVDDDGGRSKGPVNVFAYGRKNETIRRFK